MATIHNPPMLNVGGCDDCSWEPPYASLAKTRRACQSHAQSKQHATFVIVEQCTNYDQRPQRSVVDA